MTVITGGGSELGEALARAFAAAGASVALLDIGGGLRRARAFARRLAPRVVAIPCNLTRAADISRAFRAVARQWGAVDILVNNAHVEGPTCPAERISRTEWEHTLRVNLTAAFLCAREVIPLMRDPDGGSIVQLGSVGGRMAYTLRLPYSVSIAALGQLTRVLAAELGARHIRVNFVVAGPVAGATVDEVIRRRARASGRSESAVRNQYRRASVMRTMVSARDVVSLVCFVCSPAAAHITGQTLEVSAGWMADTL
ncbi:MAG: SDR family NAD(P)-dependent oxidoreductase [Vicinamibacterales bacterium]